MDEDDLSKRIDEVLQEIRGHLLKGGASAANDQQQKLVARLTNALPYLERLKNAPVNVGQAEVAAAALFSQQPQIELAESIIGDLERRRDIYKSTFRSLWEGRSQVGQLLLGIASHVLLLAIGLAAALTLAGEGFLGGLGPITVWVLVGGSLGGVTSLLVRLHDFAVAARWSPESDPRVLFFTGLLKPVVGLIFALFIWSAFSSGLVSLNLDNAATNPTLLYFALSFIAGFSERFAPDLANRAPLIRG